jgi:predicted RNA-binding protein YlqC (UPF0109 family)
MAATIDQEFIEFIVKTLVGNPDAVRIERTIDEKGVLLELYVDPGDLGRVIGRNGTTAKSIRILLRALGVKNDARYNLKIVDTNGGGRREEREDYEHRGAPVAQDDEQAHAEAVAEAKSEEPIEQPALSEDSDAEDVSVALGEEESEEKKREEDKMKKMREGLDDLDLDI